MKALHILTSIALAASLTACKKDSAEETPAEPAAETETETPTEPTPPEEPEPAAEPEPVVATANLEARSKSKVGGTISFTQGEEGKVTVEAKLTGLKPGEHGFHVHETGDCSAPDAKSAGGHFNPTKVEHGAPDSEQHHAGDFGNVTADESGNAEGTWEVDFITLEEGAENNVVGKAVVVHAKADDLKSQPSGDAGGRIACGVIEMSGDAAAPAEGAEPAEGAAPAEPTE